MKIVLLAEAQRRFEAEDEWWRENRDAKELFIEEFEQTLDRLLAKPDVGQTYRRSSGKLIRRVLMKQYPLSRLLLPRSRTRHPRDPHRLGCSSRSWTEVVVMSGEAIFSPATCAFDPALANMLRV